MPRLLIGTGIVLLLASGAYLLWRPTPVPTPAPTQGSTVPVTLSIEGFATATPRTVPAGTTALQILSDLNATDPSLMLETKDYAGLGTLVTGMHGVRNGTSNKYWQYKVNWVLPQVGAQAYEVKAGDRIEWVFAASQE